MNRCKICFAILTQAEEWAHKGLCPRHAFEKRALGDMKRERDRVDLTNRKVELELFCRAETM